MNTSVFNSIGVMCHSACRLRKIWWLAGISASILFWHALLGAETAPAGNPASPAVEPPAVAVYEGRTVAQTMHWSGASWLIRNRREREESGERMFKELQLKPGQVVCDIGCGNGYYTLAMANAVGEKGRVYAVDIQPEMLKMLEERAQKRGVKNMMPVLGSLWDPKLPENALDLVLLVDVYHEFSHPPQMLAGIRKSLKPDGELVLVEYRAEDDQVPIKPEHKMSREQILKEMRANGFEEHRHFDELPWQHMMFFRKKGAEPAPKAQK